MSWASIGLKVRIEEDDKDKEDVGDDDGCCQRDDCCREGEGYRCNFIFKTILQLSRSSLWSLATHDLHAAAAQLREEQKT